jgi:hypothetical protein
MNADWEYMALSSMGTAPKTDPNWAGAPVPRLLPPPARSTKGLWAIWKSELLGEEALEGVVRAPPLRTLDRTGIWPRRGDAAGSRATARGVAPPNLGMVGRGFVLWGNHMRTANVGDGERVRSRM